jgi:hypothetical protein
METMDIMMALVVLVVFGAGALALRHVSQTRRIDELSRSDRA